jgi:cold shock CspA family protein
MIMQLDVFILFYDNTFNAFVSSFCRESELTCAKYPVLNSNNEWTGEFKSSDPNKPSILIKDIHIDSTSDIFDPKKDYVGLIIYLYNNRSDFTLRGVHCRTGDIYIKQSDWILTNIPKGGKRSNYVHGRLFYSIFKCWKKKELDFVGAGFAYQKGRWKFNSGTLNTMNPNNNDDTYHDTNRALHEFEEKLIHEVIEHFYKNHRWLKSSPDTRISRQELSQYPPLNSVKSGVDCGVNLAMVNTNRRLHGTVIRFDRRRGFGFIKCIGINKYLFVHCSEILDWSFNWDFLTIGENVEFNIENGYKGWQAKNVTRLPPYYYPYYDY